MKCPECEEEMLKKNKVWECPNCGCSFVKNDNDNNLFTNLKDSDISNKINDYRQSNDMIGKVRDGVGNIGEQVSIQVKKEQAYIKSRNNSDSTELFDDNEFFISKVVLDGVDYVSGKKQERDESTKEKTVNTSTKTTQNNKKIYKKTKTKGKKKGLFSRKSAELKNFEKELTYYLGTGFVNSEYYTKRQNELNGFKAPSENVKIILMDEFENGNLSMDNLTNRIDELISLDNLSLIKYMLKKGYDTSVIKTQDDLHEFLKEEYDDLTADKSNLEMKLHKLGIWGFGKSTNYEEILMKELEEGNLSLDDVETRVEELRDLDMDAMKGNVFDKDYDTSIIKTQDDLYEFLKEKYGMNVAENSNKERYHKEELLKKYDIDPNESYYFECTIEEKRTSTFTNTERRNVDNAYVALYDEYMVIIKESVWLKSDMGMRKVYFKNVTSIDYDTSGILGASSSLFIHMHSGEHVHLKFVTKEIVDEVHKKYENFINKNSSNNNVITQETSNADELLKYSELYKQGILTEEEFEAKKKELL